jgi:UDP-glucuronate 4-epimerase
VYNVGGGSRVSINEVLDMVGRVVARPVTIHREPAQKGDMRDTYADTTRARTELGFAPSVALESGLAAEHRWLTSVPEWQ